MDAIKNNEDNTIGENIKKYRKLKKMKQTDLAEITGITQNNISRYENGKVVPSTRNLAMIADALAVDLSDLIDKVFIFSINQGITKSSAALSFSFKAKVNSVKMDLLANQKIKLQRELDKLLSENNIDGSKAKSLVDEIEKYNKEIALLAPDLTKPFNLADLEESPTTWENMKLGSFFLCFSELLESLFINEKEIIYLDRIIERYLLVDDKNFKTLFPPEEQNWWIDAFELIESISNCLKGSTDKEKNSLDLFRAIMSFYERPEFGITEENILEKFDFLLPKDN